MTDPKRWSDDAEADPRTRELMLAGQASTLPDSERRALWAGIALSLPVAAPPLPPPAPAPTAASLGGYLAKGALLVVALGGLTVGAGRLWPSSRPAPAKVESPVVPAPSSTVTLAPVELEPKGADVEARATSAVMPNAPKSRPASASQLGEESLAVLEARSALRSGDASRSLRLLKQARVRFPRGTLGQEREALTIEALAKSGQARAARLRADTFLRAHPTSPYVADVRRTTGQ